MGVLVLVAICVLLCVPDPLGVPRAEGVCDGVAAEDDVLEGVCVGVPVLARVTEGVKGLDPV